MLGGSWRKMNRDRQNRPKPVQKRIEERKGGGERVDEPKVEEWDK